MVTLNTKPEVLAIIPARGGSKGIPRKNIVDLCGKPLIAYTIEVALRTKGITRIVVSTDDAEIASIAIKFGAEVPFLRPKTISGDNACIGDCVKFTRDKLYKDEGYEAEAFISLYPTQPFRTPQLLDLLIEKATTGYKFAKAVKPSSVTKEDLFTLNSKKKLQQLQPSCGNDNQSQNSVVKHQGLGEVFNIRLDISPFKTFLYRIQDPISLIDIDYPDDLLLAQEIIKEKLFNFKLQ